MFRVNRNRSKHRERGDVQFSLGEEARGIGRTTGAGKHLPLPVSFSLSPASGGDSRFGERGAKGSPKLLPNLRPAIWTLEPMKLAKAFSERNAKSLEA